MNEKKDQILDELMELSDKINPSYPEVSVILSAGHGKRIKSEKSKMLHEIWGKPSVRRVCDAALKGLASPNQVIVVGKKALEVARALGKKKNRVFVFQEEQKGTGDAVRTAIGHKELTSYTGDVYVFPGDMGLLSENIVLQLKENFKACKCDMLVMTGCFEGKTEDNYYGRIIKSRKNDSVIEIKEFKDILAMDKEAVYKALSRDKNETFRREELLNIREFNTGVYAFRIDPLKTFINSITSDNVQGEIYVTDLIKIFNDKGYVVDSSRVENNNLAVAFNVKSVLKRMEETFRDIIDRDREFPALDIKIGKGVFLGEKIKINRGLTIGRNSQLKGNVHIGQNVTIGENVFISTYPDQLIEIGDNAHIFHGNVIQGNIKIGNNVRIETGVRITGSTAHPVIIGNNVLIKGVTYIFGSVIEDDLLIVHSILNNMHVEKVEKKTGEIQPVKYILPHPEGLDSISPV